MGSGWTNLLALSFIVCQRIKSGGLRFFDLSRDRGRGGSAGGRGGVVLVLVVLVLVLVLVPVPVPVLVLVPVPVPVLVLVPVPVPVLVHLVAWSSCALASGGGVGHGAGDVGARFDLKQGRESGSPGGPEAIPIRRRRWSAGAASGDASGDGRLSCPVNPAMVASVGGGS